MTTSSDVRNFKVYFFSYDVLSVLTYRALVQTTQNPPSNDRYTHLPTRLKKGRGERTQQQPIMNIGAPTEFRHVSAFNHDRQRMEAPISRPIRLARKDVSSFKNSWNVLSHNCLFQPPVSSALAGVHPVDTVTEENNESASQDASHQQVAIVVHTEVVSSSDERGHVPSQEAPEDVGPLEQFPTWANGVRLRHPLDKVERLQVRLLLVPASFVLTLVFRRRRPSYKRT